MIVYNEGLHEGHWMIGRGNSGGVGGNDDVL